MSTKTRLQEPILDGGVSSINYFNGRLLNAGDLTRERAAHREVDQRLGRALGDGVAYGLEVRLSPHSQPQSPALQIDAGLAINRNGQALSLGSPMSLELLRPPVRTATGPASFTDYTTSSSGTYIAGQGVYLLTIAPIESRVGRAPVSGLGNEGSSCNADSVIDGVQFRLIQVDSFLDQGELSEANESLIRNRIAYRFFESNEQKANTADPFGSSVKQNTLIDNLRRSILSDCDVPLAVIQWTETSGIKFVDMWAVRRRLTKPSLLGRLDFGFGDYYLSQAEAMFYQFQMHVDDLMSVYNSISMPKVTQLFRYIPPVGLLIEPSGDSIAGFDYLQFFDGLTFRNPAFIEGAKTGLLFHTAMSYWPINLMVDSTIWLYRVRENRQGLTQNRISRNQSYMIFTSGLVPYQGDSMYNNARCDYSNYSSSAVYNAE